MTGFREQAEDLRYVTEHFQDLQGLGLALFWTFLLACLLYGLIPSSGGAILTTIMASVLLLVLPRRWVRKWYSNRYGVVIKPAISKSTSPWQGWLMALILGLGIGTMWFHVFDKNNTVLAVLVVNVPILLPRCFDETPSSGTLLRRMLYSASLMALVVLTVWSLFGELSARWLLGSMAGCYLLLSIYDHYLLDHILRPGPRATENDCE